MEPLTGLRVLEFGHYISGPLAGVFLADQGADVISIVRPNAPEWNQDAQQVLARGKRVRTVDLKDARGLSEVLELAAQCDVLVENFRPGVMDRLGTGHAAVRARNPSLVYVSLPGYSRHDERANLRAYDSSISAACGLFTDLSLAGSALKLPPTHTSLPLPSVYAGLWGAIAAVSAIYARQRGGAGDHIEVSLMDAAMSSAAGVLNAVHHQPARYNVPPVSRRLLDGLSLQRCPEPLAELIHKVAWNAMPPVFRNFRCKDERLIFLCVSDNSNQIGKLLDVTGLRAVATRIGLREGSVVDSPPTRDNINAYRGPSRKWKRFEAELSAAFARENADVWIERLAHAGVPAAIQQPTREWTSMPVMIDSGVVCRHELSSGRTIVAPAPQIDLRGAGLGTSPAKELSVSASAGCLWKHDQRFVEPRSTSVGADSGAPLSDVRVVDVSNVIAGPSAARVLAELGAEVVHVSPATPAMGPRQTMLFGLDVHQGKRDVAVDLHSTAGRDFLGRIVKRADIVIYNKSPLQALRLGVAPDQVHAINERTIVTAVTAFSGLQPGGWEERPGYDPVLQALGGIMQRFGGPEHPQLHGLASCIDYFTGFSAAYASIVALTARMRGHTHLTARTSLARTTGWVQLPFLNRDERTVRNVGLSEKGSHPLDRIYRARDGWLHVHAAVSEWPTLLARAGGNAPLDPGEAGAWIARQTRKRRIADAMVWARDVGFVAQPVMNAAELRKRAVSVKSGGDTHVSAALSSGRLLRRHHPRGDSYTVPEALWLRPSSGRQRLQHAPSPGQHTREILRELGYSEPRVRRLLEEGVISEKVFSGRGFLPP